MKYDLALRTLHITNARLTGDERSEYSSGMIDLLYQIGITELLYRPSESDVITIANQLINASLPEECTYRRVMTDFILLLGTEDEDY